ncbi:MAG: hypothetical protein K8R21_04040 [Leptospira sp.]|nr:hypothetical protein [Leptospira sp.]
MKLPTALLLIIGLGFSGCAEEKSITEEAFIKEKEGKKSEALYLYSLALKKNPNYPAANKRLGMILSESGDSVGVAIFHLEKTREFAASDEETDLKLFDLYILTEDFVKLQILLDELKESLSEEDSVFLDNMAQCHKNPAKSKEIANKTKLTPGIQQFEFKLNILNGCRKNAGLQQING